MMRHVSEPIVLTWIGCLRRFLKDPDIFIEFAPMKEQVIDNLCKGTFAADAKERIV